MQVRNNLLSPISEERPAGENLQYTSVYADIKEARRSEIENFMGDWVRARKTADWALTAELITGALATQTKDLRLAVWLAEAKLQIEGVGGLGDALDLIRGLIESFWDGLYPELDEDGAEFRASCLEFLLHERLAMAIGKLPLTQGGLNWFQFRESRLVGTEAASVASEKQEDRQDLIDEGKIAQETFDQDFAATPLQFYENLDAAFRSALESLRRLEETCDQKFGQDYPHFGPLRRALSEVSQTVGDLLRKKREPSPVTETPPTENEEVPQNHATST